MGSGYTHTHAHTYLKIYQAEHLKFSHISVVHKQSKNVYRIDYRSKCNCKIIKILNMPQEYIHGFGLGEGFINKTQKALIIEENAGKLGYNKLINFSLPKHTIRE